VMPYDYVQWSTLSLSTMVSALFVLRNVVGTIMKNDCVRGGVGGGGGGSGMSSMRHKSGGGIIMCLVGCHVVFLLVVKLTFYHHDGIP
jgi:hypothetical protein